MAANVIFFLTQFSLLLGFSMDYGQFEHFLKSSQRAGDILLFWALRVYQYCRNITDVKDLIKPGDTQGCGRLG